MITTENIIFLTKMKEKYQISDADFKELLDVCNAATVNTPAPWYPTNVRDLNGGITYDNGTERVPWWVAHPEYNKINCCAANNVESKNE